MEILREENLIKVYNDGVLLIEESSYNNIKSTINKLKDIIQDVYQLNILNQILKKIELEISEVA
ncbi:hypothetical protein OQL12_002484 [Clostridium perfringens]|uniref:Uncharacterized protein n=1 Tax=Clostridium perfringens TaxID=1502 RepID=A0AB37C2D7_CLOPF|nr:hypothetical protein [Clostridium perfringens]EDT27313.1 hypothetical protein AC5_0183 [Clostridium perfringens CPE str. F4969]EGT0681541.1 hypothetical protein [Clostridium perfringens]MDH5070691.1 hypothetical protein [Clostridium perfringens]MDH5090462.1 hypothetical protein [Clostridium perfringens]MDM0722417.1 hypothetical protein [Clostridium perfringens]